MAVASAAQGSRVGAVPASRKRVIAYWVVTLFVAVSALGAGVTDIRHGQPLFDMLLHLGYPAYFATLLGGWKVLGAVALLAPRRPLLKEWAYAGMFFDYFAAVVSYAVVGGGVADYVGPLLSIGALGVSWVLRPQARRLVGTYHAVDTLPLDPSRR